MEERRFEILQDNSRLATDMHLEDALLFINAIFDKYYMEHSMVISIKEIEKTKSEEDKKSIPYLMHKEMDIPILECQKAYDIAIDYLRNQGKVRG